MRLRWNDVELNSLGVQVSRKLTRSARSCRVHSQFVGFSKNWLPLFLKKLYQCRSRNPSLRTPLYYLTYPEPTTLIYHDNELYLFLSGQMCPVSTVRLHHLPLWRQWFQCCHWSWSPPLRFFAHRALQFLSQLDDSGVCLFCSKSLDQVVHAAMSGISMKLVQHLDMFFSFGFSKRNHLTPILTNHTERVFSMFFHFTYTTLQVAGGMTHILTWARHCRNCVFLTTSQLWPQTMVGHAVQNGSACPLDKLFCIVSALPS